MATETSIQISTRDGVINGFLYSPDRASGLRWPGVLRLTDIFGIRTSQRDDAARLADEGYVVLMPNIFYRVGDPPFLKSPVDMKDEHTRKQVNELRASLPPDAVGRDAEAYVTFLSAQPAVAPGPFGVVGYCFSGAMAMRVAAAQPSQFAAMGSFHGGGLLTDDPSSPHHLLPRIAARMYFGHAFQDGSMPADVIVKFEHALAESGRAFESETYEGAGHGWTVSDSHAYNKPQAERAYAKLVALLAATLGGCR